MIQYGFYSTYSRNRGQLHLIPEVFQRGLSHIQSVILLFSAKAVVTAIIVYRVLREQMVYNRQDLMRDSHGRILVPYARLHSSIICVPHIKNESDSQSKQSFMQRGATRCMDDSRAGMTVLRESHC